jgi:hypothetical protein
MVSSPLNRSYSEHLTPQTAVGGLQKKPRPSFPRVRRVRRTMRKRESTVHAIGDFWIPAFAGMAERPNYFLGAQRYELGVRYYF